MPAKSCLSPARKSKTLRETAPRSVGNLLPSIIITGLQHTTVPCGLGLQHDAASTLPLSKKKL